MNAPQTVFDVTVYNITSSTIKRGTLITYDFTTTQYPGQCVSTGKTIPAGILLLDLLPLSWGVARAIGVVEALVSAAAWVDLDTSLAGTSMSDAGDGTMGKNTGDSSFTIGFNVEEANDTNCPPVLTFRKIKTFIQCVGKGY